MLLRNLELEGKKNDLVNGSRGVVVGWKSKQEKLKELERKGQDIVILTRLNPRQFIKDSSAATLSSFPLLRSEISARSTVFLSCLTIQS